jgi:hypothetical protein
MSNESNNKTESKKQTNSKIPIFWATLAIVFTAVISVILCFFTNTFSSYIDYIMTFWVSFLIGLGGAGVYLMLLLIVEGHLKILKNNIVGNLGIMSYLFLLSGGFVAAITQVSTGLLVAGGAQAVFMVGFGWLGALSGVGGVKARAQLNEENKDLAEIANEADLIVKSTTEGLKKDKDSLLNIIEEGKKRIETLTEELNKLKKKRGNNN